MDVTANRTDFRDRLRRQLKPTPQNVQRQGYVNTRPANGPRSFRPGPRPQSAQQQQPQWQTQQTATAQTPQCGDAAYHTVKGSVGQTELNADSAVRKDTTPEFAALLEPAKIDGLAGRP
jgi:hypothetical protein